MPSIISVSNLSKTYGSGFQALKDVNLEIAKGEIFALLGPNGAGKTTTVEILEGFRERSGGRVETLGVDPAVHSTQRWLRTRIGVVLQELAVEPYYSVRQVLTRNAGYYPNPRPVDEVIALIGLAEKRDQRIKRLSGGQQRRLDVGLGIIGNPELLFLDEPTTGLDPESRTVMWEEVRGLARQGLTLLLTTHYLEEADQLAQRLAILDDGRVVAEGTPEALKARLRGDRVSVELADRGQVAAARQVLADLDEVAAVLVDGTTLYAQVAHSASALPSLLAALDRAGLAVAQVALSRPSLDDVYLDATGHAYRSEGAGHGDRSGGAGRAAAAPTPGAS
jgi:ABC-2 type transport system ATP-binding protein